MPKYNWQSFLESYSLDLLADPKIRSKTTDDVRASRWMGFPPASTDEIAHLESRIGLRLPDSYRQFLATTNGWRNSGYFISMVFPAGKVEWFRTHNQDWIDAYVEPARESPPVTLEQHCIYGDEQDDCLFRVEFLESSLQISDVGDAAVYLLNPEVKTQSGEWEAWFFATWLPGATRYQSFWELMQSEREGFTRLREHQKKRLDSDDDRAAIALKLAGLVDVIDAKIQGWRKIQEKQRSKGQQTDEQYNVGIVNSLTAARSAVELLAAAGPSQIDRDRLVGIACGLESEWQAAVRPNECRLDEAAGRAEGNREAAGIIRWFLNE